jgi:hypothetical protein
MPLANARAGRQVVRFHVHGYLLRDRIVDAYRQVRRHRRGDGTLFAAHERWAMDDEEIILESAMFPKLRDERRAEDRPPPSDHTPARSESAPI